jgi:nitroimidazol reductase NimA-like FMN-containing flavoprotein (pyridoxamine 5'-phosphate oxidase superfamily)
VPELAGSDTPPDARLHGVSDLTEPASARTKVRRLAERGRYDEATVHAILDEGLIAHVAVVTDQGPLVLPTAYARVGRTVYLHGAAGNALLRAAEAAPVCATVTLLDGLVLAKSAFHHSMNYRSVVIFATGRRVEDEDERRIALDAIVEHIVPGRTAEARAPNPSELRATRVLALDLGEASAKVRTGPPKDDEADAAWPAWTGVIPITTVHGTPEPAPPAAG